LSKWRTFQLKIIIELIKLNS